MIRVVAGADWHEVASRLEAGVESFDGPARAVVCAANRVELVFRVRDAGSWLRGGGPAPDGVYFRAEPLGGETAFVFPSGSMAYVGMGEDFAHPGHAEAVCERFGRRLGPQTTAMDQIWATVLLSAVHVEVTTELFGLRPDAAIGYSTGELTAAMAFGLWPDVRQVIEDLDRSRSARGGIVGEFDMVRRAWRRIGVTGEVWRNAMVSGPLDAVVTALRGEPAVHLAAINAPDLCVLGGEARALAAFTGRLARSHAAVPVPYEIAVHAPLLEEAAAELRALYLRPVTATAVRFYSGITGSAYEPTPENLADALAAQVVATIDFVRVVEQAYADGVRTFVEHGPQGMCTTWIRRILRDRPHLAVALDNRAEPGVDTLERGVAQVLAAGTRSRAEARRD